MRLGVSVLAVFWLVMVSGCNHSGSSGTDDSVVAAASVSGTVTAMMGSSGRSVSVTFNTSDGQAAHALAITTNLAALPDGWSAPSASFDCAEVSTGSGCVLALTYAPSTHTSGTLILAYSYQNNAGAMRTGTVAIPYEATANDNVVASASPAGQVNAVVGAGTQTVNVGFTTDDGNVATGLTVTTALGNLPSGWSVGSTSFDCASVSTGNGCQLALAYAPTADGSGTLTLQYTYSDNSGTGKTGSVSIPYAATTHDHVVGTPSPSGQINAVVGAGTQTVNVGFTTDDGNVATGLTVTTLLGSLPSGWSSNSSSFSCPTVSVGNGCELALSYAPTADGTGTLTLQYAYTDNAGTAQTGSVSVSYAAMTHDHVIGAPSPSGQVNAVVGAGTQPVTVSFTTDDGNIATGLTVTTSLGSLPSGWTSGSPSFGCANVSTGNGCQLALTYAPIAYGSGTLTLQYAYTDNAGSAQVGSVNIPYTATTHDNIVATVSPSGTVSATSGGAQAVTVTFTTDDGNPATSLAVTSGLSSLPSGWSGSSSFACSSITTGNGCQLNLSYAPSVSGSGTLSIGYGYSDDAGVAKTGTVNIAYVANLSHVYVTDASGAVTVCSVGANGALSGCASAATGFNSPVSIAVLGNYAYIGEMWNFGVVEACLINSDATLSGCSAVGSNYNGDPGGLAAHAGLLYIADLGDFNGPLYCTVTGTGSFSSCASSYGANASNQAWDVAFAGTYAYVTTVGDQSDPYINVCTVGGDGSLSGCADAGFNSFGQAQAVVSSGNTVYFLGYANGNLGVCTVGTSGSLTNCSTSVPYPAPTGDSVGYSGLAVSGGYAYLTYIVAQPGTGFPPNPITVATGVAVCPVNGDGTLGTCVDSGQTFTGRPLAVTVH